MSEVKSTIALKLVAAMGEIDAVTKEGKNEMQGYKYVKAADVAQEVRKVLVKHGIAFGFDVIEEERWTSDRFSKDGTVIGHMNYVRIVADIEFEDAETGQKKVRKARGWGNDVGEKAIYKAMTGALKYALRMNFIIPDESDPENDKAEVHAEVERQKAETGKVTGFIKQAEASLAKIDAEKRAANERNQLAEKQGLFSLDGDVLSCKIVGIQKKQMSAKTKTPGKEFLSVTFNGRLENGSNFASVFDTELYEPLNAALDKDCRLRIEVKGAYAQVKDVLWIQGVGEDAPFKATDDDIPF